MCRAGGERAGLQDAAANSATVSNVINIFARRSINHPSAPPTDEYVRGEVLPSGFILTPWIMDDGMADWRDDTKQQQTSFDYVVQLDKTGQEMAGFGNPDSPYIRIMVKSIVKLCTQLKESEVV